VTWRLKAGIVEQKDGNGVANNIFTATNQQAIMKALLEAAFLVRALSRLYSENQKQQSSTGRDLKAPRAIRE
jgi:hypothetical protein